MSKKIFFQFSFTFFLVLFLFLPNTYAASPNLGWFDLGTIFGENENDYIVRNFLPYFGYSTNAYDESNLSLPLRAVMIPFLIAMMGISFILLGYNAFVGTINTAQEGKFLGGKWSTVFTPIRTTIGFTLLLPIISGFSIIQNVIVWAASQSIWLSNFMLNRYLDTNQSNLVGKVLLNKNTRINLLEDMNETIKMKVCQNYFQYLANDPNLKNRFVSNNNIPENGNVLKMANAETYDGSKLTYRLGYNYASASDLKNISVSNLSSVCGVVTIESKAVSKETGSWEFHKDNSPTIQDQTGNQFFTGNVSMVDSNLYKQVVQEQFNVSKKYMIENGSVSDKVAIALLKAVDEIAKPVNAAKQEELTQKHVQDIAALLHKESYNYLNDLNKLVTNSQLGDLINVDDLKRAGVAGAGAWFFAINLQSDQISSIINSPPKIDRTHLQLPDVARMQNIEGNFANNYQAAVMLLERAKAYLRNNYVDYSGYGLNNQLQGRVIAANNELGIGYQTNTSSNNTMNAFNRLYSGTLGSNQSLSDFLTSSTNNPLTPNDFNSVGIENPLIFTHVFGMKLLTWASTLLEKAPYEMSAMVIPIAITLLSISIMLAYYVPLMPFIVWVSSIIGWIGLLCEAMVGVVLWAVAHIIPDKDGFVGRQGQGYMLMLSFLTRLPMLVIGFVFAESLLTPIGKYVNEFFSFSAKTLISGTGLTWTLSVLAMCLIFAFIMVSLVKNIISLMYKISDNSLMWIGGPTTGAVGQMVQGIEGQSQSGFQQGMGSVSSVGNSLGMIVRGQNSTIGGMIKSGKGASTIDEAISKNDGGRSSASSVASQLNRGGNNRGVQTGEAETATGMSGSSLNSGATRTSAASYSGMFDSNTQTEYSSVRQNQELKEGIGKLNADLNSNDASVRGNALNSLKSGEYQYEDSRGNTRTLDLSGMRMNATGQELKPENIGNANTILNSKESNVNDFLQSTGSSNERDMRLRSGSISRDVKGLSRISVK